MKKETFQEYRLVTAQKLMWNSLNKAYNQRPVTTRGKVIDIFSRWYRNAFIQAKHTTGMLEDTFNITHINDTEFDEPLEANIVYSRPVKIRRGDHDVSAYRFGVKVYKRTKAS